MKFYLSIMIFLISVSTMASICDLVKPNLLWKRDQIIDQYECKNANMVLCVTKAIYGNDNSEYVVLSGNVNTTKGHPTIDVFARTLVTSEGLATENDSQLTLNYTPVPAFIIDEDKFHYEFILDKRSGEAHYTEQSKKILAFSLWSTLISEDLRCQLI